MSLRRVRVFVSGKVQRVRFRESTREQANQLGVTGWVKNLPDKRVELVAQGESAQIEALLAWAQRGPPAAQVTAVEVKEEPTIQSESGFLVL